MGFVFLVKIKTNWRGKKRQKGQDGLGWCGWEICDKNAKRVCDSQTAANTGWEEIVEGMTVGGGDDDEEGESEDEDENGEGTRVADKVL